MQLDGLGEQCKLPYQCPGGAPAANAFWRIYGSQNAPRGSIFQLLPPNISYDATCVTPLPPALDAPAARYVASVWINFIGQWVPVCRIQRLSMSRSAASMTQNYAHHITSPPQHTDGQLLSRPRFARRVAVLTWWCGGFHHSRAVTIRCRYFIDRHRSFS